MSIAVNAQELRALRAVTYQWVDTLAYDVAHLHERVSPQVLDQALARITDSAVGFSWGTTHEVYSQVPHLVDTLNDVAIAAGTVARDGSAKAREPIEALRAAKRAHGAVQTAMMDRGWQQRGQYFFPS